MDKYIDDIWKNGGEYTHQEKLYLECLSKQLPLFTGGVVLEIGPGTGKFAHELINKYNITKYYVLDIDKNINDSVEMLKTNCPKIEVVPVLSQNYRTLFNIDFDLIVSNVCIPETPKTYREDLLNNVIPNTINAMIIGQLGGWGREGHEEYEGWIKGLFNDNFHSVMCELTPYANCYSLTGCK